MTGCHFHDEVESMHFLPESGGTLESRRKPAFEIRPRSFLGNRDVSAALRQSSGDLSQVEWYRGFFRLIEDFYGTFFMHRPVQKVSQTLGIMPPCGARAAHE